MGEGLPKRHNDVILEKNVWRRPLSARWSPMYQYLALTSLRGSHPLPTRNIRQSGPRQATFLLTSVFPFPYFRFRTSVSVQRFPLALFLVLTWSAHKVTGG